MLAALGFYPENAPDAHCSRGTQDAGRHSLRRAQTQATFAFYSPSVKVAQGLCTSNSAVLGMGTAEKPQSFRDSKLHPAFGVCDLGKDHAMRIMQPGSSSNWCFFGSIIIF